MMTSHVSSRPSLVLSALCLVLAKLCSSAQHNLIPDVGHHYPVHIGAEGHIVQGRISSEAELGQHVPSDVILEGDEDADTKVYLRVEVRDSIYSRPHVFHPDHKVNSSVIEQFPNSSLPFGMQFVIIHTNAFFINDDRYITANDFSNLNGETRIHFDVILKDNLAETKYVSNQLHFVVEIEYPKREVNPNAVLFAGVLVLTIVIISLLIPFVVRAKRRSKAGKPIFRCGSADSDIDSLGSVPDHLRNRANSIGGKDNLAMILDNGRMKHQRPSVAPQTTIQNHLLRSTSGLQFQPHCRDPHYNDVYARPDYSTYQIAPDPDKTDESANTSPPSLAPSTSAPPPSTSAPPPSTSAPSPSTSAPPPSTSAPSPSTSAPSPSTSDLAHSTSSLASNLPVFAPNTPALAHNEIAESSKSSANNYPTNCNKNMSKPTNGGGTGSGTTKIDGLSEKNGESLNDLDVSKSPSVIAMNGTRF